jgi:hypothetical protein
MPGNIVCGICGAVRYYAFILQAKKFGTFSCEPCRKFISKTINSSNVNFECVSDTGTCVVPPGNKAAVKDRVDTRCQESWKFEFWAGNYA